MGRQNPTRAQECLTDCLISRALDGLAVGLILTDPSENIIWLNRSAKRMLALNDDNAIGRPLSQVAQDPQLMAFWQEASRINENLMGSVSVRWPEPMELKVNATACHDLAGEPIGRALLFCDVTKERNIQFELSQDVANRLLVMAGNPAGNDGPTTGLTPQELQVLKLVGNGLSNQEIAERIHVSGSTIRSHLKSVYRKTGLKSRSQAVSFALRNHLA